MLTARSMDGIGCPADKLDEALDGVQVVVIPAGVPRKLYMPSITYTSANSIPLSRRTNASIVRDLAAAIGRVAPTAYILVISTLPFPLLPLPFRKLVFTTPLAHLGSMVSRKFTLGPLSAEEEKLLEACLPELKKSVEKGKAFVESS
ncbi:hypothetical protein BD769DRAFT_1644099 [Suillus cothurnatus]|nr:hypothetical protein BD769DRAFT_1644099 [Suillus cothurnatus]